MSRKKPEPGTAAEERPARLGRPAGSGHQAPSTILPSAVKSGPDDALPETLLAPPSSGDATRTSEPLPSEKPLATEPFEAPATQVRAPQRYQIINEHGRGGLGRVSRAHDRELGRDVAIKELISRGHISEVRFLREALITARLEHPGIVPVHEAGRWPDGTPFYAMKLVSGRPLRDLIAERPTVDERIGLLHHVIAVADAIAYAHGKNIIHRDLKPANVIVGEFGETIVIDWGLAKDLSTTEDSTVGGGPFRTHRDDDLTSAGTVLGTPAYMAPEQQRGEHVDQRADVYAIGAMLWELCAQDKVPPADPHVRRRTLRRVGIDRDLATIIDKSLDPDPKHRYPDAGALAADLKAFKSGARIAARSYSLLGVLIHWTRRHRALALIVLTSILVLSATILVSFINIAHDRAVAISSRESAIIATATALLGRDPTRAWAAIQSIPPNAATALLRARITAGGVADSTLELPARLTNLLESPSGKWLVVSTADRALYTISLDTGIMSLITDALTEPSVFAVTDDLVYVVRRQEQLTLASLPVTGGTINTLTVLEQIPTDLQANSIGVLWSAPSGTLTSMQRDGATRVIARDTAQFGLVDAQIVICSRDGLLRIVQPTVEDKTLGPCLPGRPWSTAASGFAIPKTDSLLTVVRHGKAQTFEFESGINIANPSFSLTGLFVAVDAQGVGAILRPTDTKLDRIQLNGRTTAMSARDDYAAWGYAGGGVKVLDTRSGHEWSIQAHPEDVWWVGLLPDGRLVTSGRKTVRFWTLPPTTSVLLAQIPAFAYNIAFDRHQDTILGGNDGNTYLIRPNSHNALAIHKHDQISYGVAWCGDLACSTGWDTNVICTDIHQPNALSTSRALPTSTIWIATGNSDGICYIAAADGGVYTASPGNASQDIIALYRHDREPYRLAVSHDGALVASGDWGGSVTVYNTSLKHITATRRIHDGLVTNIFLTTTRIITSGVDGWVHVLDFSLQEVQSWRLGSAIRYLVASRDRISAALEDGDLWMVSLRDGAQNRFKTNTTFTSSTISPNGLTIATGTSDGEILVINKDYEIATIRLERGRVTCAAFNTETELTACSPSGRIIRVQLSTLKFEHPIIK
jgi:serine/threonine protein kinase